VSVFGISVVRVVTSVEVLVNPSVGSGSMITIMEVSIITVVSVVGINVVVVVVVVVVDNEVIVFVANTVVFVIVFVANTVVFVIVVTGITVVEVSANVLCMKGKSPATRSIVDSKSPSVVFINIIFLDV
jgi:hypothetical protein